MLKFANILVEPHTKCFYTVSKETKGARQNEKGFL